MRRAITHVLAGAITVALLLNWKPLAVAQDHLNTFKAGGWSVDGSWLAFNWVSDNQLFVVSMKTGEAFLLKPLGSADLELETVVSAEAPANNLKQAKLWKAKLIPSTGFGKLRFLEWAPDCRNLAFKIDRHTLGLFSIFEESITRKWSASEPLPWARKEKLHVAIELKRATAETPAHYVLSVQRIDGTTVKELQWSDPAEVTCVGVARFHRPGFLSNNQKFLLYPRYREDKWQLMREAVTGDEAPRRVGPPGELAPRGWQLTADDRYLAVLDKQFLRIGRLEQWEQAHSIPMSSRLARMEWAPDGRFLAFRDQQGLYLVSPEDGRPLLVSRSSSSYFWGWRGTRLYFGNAETDSTDLRYVDEGEPGKIVHLVRPRHWPEAPRWVSISPDGKGMGCVVRDIDGAGRRIQQLWQIALEPGAEWQLVFNLFP